MADEQKDVIRVFDTPANLSANLKDKMIGGDTTNDRFAGKWPTNTMRYVSHDGLQCLLATVQTLTGAKTFSALLTALAGIDLTGVFNTRSVSQTITTDNDTLLNVDVTSFLTVVTASTSDPTAYTVGLKPGLIDGQRVTITEGSEFTSAVFEINQSVPGSAFIRALDPGIIGAIPVGGAADDGTSTSVSFIWDALTSTWMQTGGVLVLEAGDNIAIAKQTTGKRRIFLTNNINVSGIFSNTAITQNITTDNNTLLNVHTTSFLRVTTATTGSPASYTVGFNAGSIDGQRVTVLVEKGSSDAFEINESVPSSASIIPKDRSEGFPITMGDVTGGTLTRSFIWNDNDSSWYEI